MEIRDKFAYIDFDPLQQKRRLYFDNAGGSFRLKSANETFAQLDLIPNCPMRDHEVSRYLSEFEQKGIDDSRIIFNAKTGSIATYLTASEAIFDITGVIAENVAGTNIVTTALEASICF